MSLRELNLNDLMILERHSMFPLPNLTSKLYCIKKSIEDDGKLLGSFWVKLTSETSLILEPSLSRLAKARAIKEIFDFLVEELTSLGLDDSHLFIENDNLYVEILKKHFGFKDNLGTPLYINAGGLNGKEPNELRYTRR